jgi:hypothetical protein
MHRTARWVTTLALVIGTGLPLAGCGQPPTSTTKVKEPYTSEPIGDSGVKRLTLDDKAVERLALDTATVIQMGDRLVIPYAALLYLPDGTTITYTNPDGHSYVREQVTVEIIRDDQAVLTAGPQAGTKVVTTGGAELWGAEFGIK